MRRITFRTQSTMYHCTCSQFLALHLLLRRCCGAGGSVMTPVFTEVPLGGEDQLWPKCSPAGRARLFAGRRERHREEPVIMRTANSGVTGEQPHMMQSRLFPALLTCCLSLPTLVSAKRRKEVRRLMPKLFCLVCANTFDSKEA